ncbi:MAG: hypothetical protein LBU56_03945 [Rickettsiales bacterium]|nr:hypothetical protein [Rickettsiales bacterium]
MLYLNITFIFANLIKFPDFSVTRWNDKVMGVIPVLDTGIQDTTLVINI